MCWYDIVGVALGTAIPLVAAGVTTLPIFICHIMNLPISTFLRKILPIIAVAGIEQLSLLFAMTQIQIYAYWQLVAWVMGYYTPLIIFFYTIMLTSEERQLFMEALPWSPQMSRNAQAGKTEENHS